MKKIKLFKLFLITCFIITILWFGLTFAPGSYPNVEKYEFNIPEEELIKNINKLKKLETNLKVPVEYKEFEFEGKKKHWYHFCIYYSKENEIIYCWVRSYAVNNSTIAFLSIRSSNGKYKLIEKDFDASEIEIQKKKFEDRFINKLNNLLKEK